MKILKGRTLPVLLAALVVVGGLNVAAYAATGGNFILGHINKAGQASTLQRTTAGPPLLLKTKLGGNAPFATNGKGKVTNLNADRLDGLDGQALQTRTLMYTIPAETDFSIFSVSLPGLAPGLYQATFSVTAATSSQLHCYILHDNSQFEMLAYGSSHGGSFSTSNAAGVVDTRQSAAKFTCFIESGTGTIVTSAPTPQLTFTRIDGISHVSAVAARPAPLRPSTIR